MKKLTILSATFALAFFLGLAPTARGGTYKAIQCYERSGAGHADAAYDSSSQHYSRSADCEGKGLGVTHRPGSNRTGSGKFGAWTLTAPAGTTIVRAAARVDASRQQFHVPQVLIGIEGGARDLLDGVHGDLHTVDWEGAGGSYFSGRLVCVNRQDCGEGKDAYLYMRRIGLTLDDVTAPTLQLGGTLLEPGSRRGDQVLDVNTADTGSGVRSVTVEVNGQPLDTRTLECQVKDDVAIRLRPCPGAPTPSFDIATSGAEFRQGPNELTVCSSDFSPEATANTTCESRTVRIDNACPISPVPGTVLRARFKGAGERMTAPSNATATVIGKLTDAGGSPVRDAKVCIATRVATTEGPPERVISTPTTSSKGSFRTRLPAGPSREVRVAHWYGPHEVTERFLDLNAKAVPRLSVSPDQVHNGETIRFEVRIPGPAQANRRIAVQARGTGKWIRIDGGRTDRGGRWSGNYRFKRTTTTRTYGFRATIRRQPGYPYAPGHSKTKRVTVKG